MKPVFTLLYILLSFWGQAQLTLLPQLGFDRTNTAVSYNNMNYKSPLGSYGNCKANFRIDYRFKNGHGPYLSIGTSPSLVSLSFQNPPSAVSEMTVVKSSKQWKIESGYQYSSRPIQLKKSSAPTNAANSTSNTNKTYGCGATRMSCGSKSKSKEKKQPEVSFRLQPSIGFAYQPDAKNDIQATGGGYTYNAGNWRTAFVTGMGFEFGKGKQRWFTLGLHYTKGLANLDTKTIVSEESGKEVLTNFRSKFSSWGLTWGVPITIAKKNKSAVKTEKKQQCKTSTEKVYKSSCTKRF